MGLTFGVFLIWVIYLPLFIQNNSSKQGRETKDREIFRNSSDGLPPFLELKLKCCYSFSYSLPAIQEFCGMLLFFHNSSGFRARVCLFSKNKNALTAAITLACLEIRSRNEEAINSTLITFAYNESLQHPTIAVLPIKILIFSHHSVVFTCSKVINAFKR